MESLDFLRIVSDGGIIGILILIIVSGMKQWWVFGWLYQKETKEKELWRTLALRGTSLAERSIEMSHGIKRENDDRA